jgi:hypothetical protein
MGQAIAGVIIGAGLQIGFLVILLVSAMLEAGQVDTLPEGSPGTTHQQQARGSNRLRVVRETAEPDQKKRAA